VGDLAGTQVPLSVAEAISHYMLTASQMPELISGQVLKLTTSRRMRMTLPSSFRGRLESSSEGIRAAIVEAYQMSRVYEKPLTNTLIGGLAEIAGVSIYGITNPNRVKDRVPAVPLRHNNVTPSDIASALALAGIHALYSYSYAYALDERLDRGVARFGQAHYNTKDEIETIIS
jgi:selenocysteine lyase/cysteine desulfurase